MATEELEQQIERERKEIEDAPKIPVAQLRPRDSGTAGRCHWCGRFSQNLVLVEVVNGQERYKGVECCGGRHV